MNAVQRSRARLSLTNASGVPWVGLGRPAVTVLAGRWALLQTGSGCWGRSARSPPPACASCGRPGRLDLRRVMSLLINTTFTSPQRGQGAHRPRSATASVADAPSEGRQPRGKCTFTRLVPGIDMGVLGCRPRVYRERTCYASPSRSPLNMRLVGQTDLQQPRRLHAREPEGPLRVRRPHGRKSGRDVGGRRV